MSQQITRIKQRIKSVSGALKVTSAMKLVSTVKLKKWKGKMLANRDYSSRIDEITEEILSYANKVKTPFDDVHSEVKKNLYIIVSSTLGLCGSYNNNIFKVADVTLKKEDDAIILGGKGIAHFKHGEFVSLPGFDQYASISDTGIIRHLTDYVIKEFTAGHYAQIHLIYSSYKNSLIFLAKDVVILPIKKVQEENGVGFAPLMEPTPQKLVDSLIHLYLKTVIYSKLLESEVCEQGARRNAMENATDNANDLLDNLQIEFNKARQAAITQEITEIVGAAETI